MNTEKIRTIVKATVEELKSSDKTNSTPLLSLRDLASLTDIPMRTMKAYQEVGAFDTLTTMGIELIDVAAFREWCLENLKGKRKARAVGRLDIYLSQFETK